MIYAIIENGIVVNIVVGPLPNALSGITTRQYPVAIGDIYQNGVFLRDGVPLVEEAIIPEQNE